MIYFSNIKTKICLEEKKIRRNYYVRTNELWKTNEIGTLFDDLEKNFFRSSATQKMSMKTDIIEKEDAFVLESELPGFEKEDINIDISGGLLTIKANHKEEKEEKDEKGNYIRKERSFGSYFRSFNVEKVKLEDIKAEYTNGILKLTLPKLDKDVPQTRRIEVQ